MRTNIWHQFWKLGPVVCGASFFLATAYAKELVSFERDVMAVISKAGCNLGACHGNFKGKGGFRLSLRGESPDLDHQAIAESSSARRVVKERPEESLILRKPTLLTGHEGDKRFEVGSLEYTILLKWIEQGARVEPADAPSLEMLEVSPADQVLVAPGWEVQLKVVAHFSDESRRDVSCWAVYEPSGLIADVSEDGRVTGRSAGEITIAVRYLNLQQPVRLAFLPERPDWKWRAPDSINVIDEHVFAKLHKLRMNPSEPASETTFARRAYLDIIGRPPTATEARAFLEMSGDVPSRRGRLIDELLQTPEFADFWALKWSDILRIEEKVLDSRGVKVFHGWIRDRIAEGMPVDAFARAMITASGSTYRNPPANYYRSLRNPTVRAEATAQVFLGTRLQCARCHNHPYEKWTQDQYYELAAAFDGINYDLLSNNRRDGLDKNEFRGEQIVRFTAGRQQKHPKGGHYPDPGFLGQTPKSFSLASMVESNAGNAINRFASNRAFFQSMRHPLPEQERLKQLGHWMTSPENPLFARTQVNRIWYHLVGQGIIDPVDDLRATNPPVNAPLLDALVEHFVASGYDLRSLVKLIATSQVYALSSVPNDSNRDDATNFSHAVVRRLTAEQLIDAMHQVVDVAIEWKDEEKGTRAVQVAGVPIAGRTLQPGSCEQFLKMFGKPERLLSSDLERSNATSLAQVLALTSGQTVDRLLRDQGNRISDWLNQEMADEELVEEACWWTLSRPPTFEETSALSGHLARSSERRQAVEDIVWSLLNSKTFLLRH